jgi:3-dehydroquinate synthase
MQNISLRQLIQNIENYDHFIIDQTVFELYKNELSFLNSKKVFFVVDPEKSKNINTYNTILEFFLEMGITRADTIIAIGGGATTDLSGFVASTILRGISWVSIPTTLLAMVDASIGGKVGINTKHGKNLIGNFHKPDKTLFCFTFLGSLDSSEIESGKGEILKYCFLDILIKEKCMSEGYSNELIFECAKLKIQIVEEDFKENGKRAILNFGHTFGHALELLSNLPHGIAVAKGIEVNLSLFNSELIKEFQLLCSVLEINIPNSFKLNKKSFFKLLQLDKKNKSNSQIGIVVLEKSGPCLKYMNADALLNILEVNEIQNDLF